ncbi:hypothetical protein ID866_13098 [Astraeus odoratus]|nr:hypothetical protein ID866_13098 [Astraeus odoratus]
MCFRRKHALLPYLPNGISEWTSVLKLATTWGFKDTRQAAIDALNDSQIGLVDRVVLAQTYDIKDWLLPALNQLAQRAEPISLEEAGRIGVDVALKMTWVRERLKSTSIHHCSRCGSSDGNAAFSVSDSRDYAAQGFDYSEAIRTTLAL